MHRAGAVSASELRCTPYSSGKSEHSPLTPCQEAEGQSVNLWGSSAQTCYANFLVLSFILIWLVCRVGKLHTRERSLPSLRLPCMCWRTVQKLEEFLQSSWRRKKGDERKCGIKQGSGENLVILSRATPSPGRFQQCHRRLLLQINISLDAATKQFVSIFCWLRNSEYCSYSHLICNLKAFSIILSILFQFLELPVT